MTAGVPRRAARWLAVPLAVACIYPRAADAQVYLPRAAEAHGTAEREDTVVREERAAREQRAGRAWLFEPTVSLGLTATDNYALQPEAESDLITRLGAGLRISGNSRYVRGFLDYTLTAYDYARHSDSDEVFNLLLAEGTAEVVESLVFVDMQASISQQTESLTGTYAVDPTRQSSNRTEVARLAVTPYAKGRMGTFAEYDVRATYDETRVESDEYSSVTERLASARLRGTNPNLYWLGEASYEASDFSLGRATNGYWVRAGLGGQASSELALEATVGHEANNILTLQRESYATWGVRARWLPTDRTSLDANYDKRYFGDGYSLLFSHRTRQTVWSFTSAQYASVDVAGAPTAATSVYDLYSRRFEATEQDPIRRDLLVREYLRANGIDPTTSVVNGFLTSAVTEWNVQAFSLGLVGARNTVTLRLEKTRSKRLDPIVAAIDDLAGGGEARERGAILEVAHRLTPVSSVSASAVYRKSRQAPGVDTGAVPVDTDLRSVSLAWSGRTGAYSDFRLGVRYTVVDSTTTVNSYRERAATATYRLQF